MKKVDMLKELKEEMGIDASGDTWKEIQQKYKAYKDFIKVAPNEDIDELNYELTWMVNELKSNGWSVENEDDYFGVNNLYRDMTELKSIENPIERRERELQLKRKALIPKIKDLIGRLRGRSNINNHEVNEILNLYNKYYLRRESAGCGSCVARCYDALKRLV